MITIKKYLNLLDKDSFNHYNAWKSDEMFDFSYMDEDNIDILNDYMIEEQVYEGVLSHRNENHFDEKLKQFKEGLKKELNYDTDDKQFVYIIASEHKAYPPNRVRSYKGLIDKKKVLGGDFIQNEIKIEENLSLIAFIAIINIENIDYLIKYFFDDDNCFIVKSDNFYLKNNILDEIISKFISKGIIKINYVKLLTLNLFKNDIIYRIGGDGGENYWSIQKFLKK